MSGSRTAGDQRAWLPLVLAHVRHSCFCSSMHVYERCWNCSLVSPLAALLLRQDSILDGIYSWKGRCKSQERLVGWHVQLHGAGAEGKERRVGWRLLLQEQVQSVSLGGCCMWQVRRWGYQWQGWLHPYNGSVFLCSSLFLNEFSLLQRGVRGNAQCYSDRGLVGPMQGQYSLGATANPILSFSALAQTCMLRLPSV